MKWVIVPIVLLIGCTAEKPAEPQTHTCPSGMHLSDTTCVLDDFTIFKGGTSLGNVAFVTGSSKVPSSVADLTIDPTIHSAEDTASIRISFKEQPKLTGAQCDSGPTGPGPAAYAHQLKISLNSPTDLSSYFVSNASIKFNLRTDKSPTFKFMDANTQSSPVITLTNAGFLPDDSAFKPVKLPMTLFPLSSLDIKLVVIPFSLEIFVVTVPTCAAGVTPFTIWIDNIRWTLGS